MPEAFELSEYPGKHVEQSTVSLISHRDPPDPVATAAVPFGHEQTLASQDRVLAFKLYPMLHDAHEIIMTPQKRTFVHVVADRPSGHEQLFGTETMKPNAH